MQNQIYLLLSDCRQKSVLSNHTPMYLIMSVCSLKWNIQILLYTVICNFIFQNEVNLYI